MSDELHDGPFGILSVTDILARIESNMYGAQHNAARWDEIKTRAQNHMHGKAGRAAMLSRAQVRACLGPLLFDDTAGELTSTFEFQKGYNDAIHAAARALLNIGPGEKSPLEED